MPELALALASTVDNWRAIHPAVTAIEVLSALEEIRYALTEALIKNEEEE